MTLDDQVFADLLQWRDTAIRAFASYDAQHAETIAEHDRLRSAACRAQAAIPDALLDAKGPCVIEHEYRANQWAKAKYTGAPMRFKSEEDAVQFIKYLRAVDNYRWCLGSKPWRIRNEQTGMMIPDAMLVPAPNGVTP